MTGRSRAVPAAATAWPRGSRAGTAQTAGGSRAGTAGTAGGSCRAAERFLQIDRPVPARRPGRNRLGRAVPAQEPGSNRRTTLGCCTTLVRTLFLLNTPRLLITVSFLSLRPQVSYRGASPPPSLSKQWQAAARGQSQALSGSDSNLEYHRLL